MNDNFNIFKENKSQNFKIAFSIIAFSTVIILISILIIFIKQIREISYETNNKSLINSPKLKNITNTLKKTKLPITDANKNSSIQTSIIKTLNSSDKTKNTFKGKKYTKKKPAPNFYFRKYTSKNIKLKTEDIKTKNHFSDSIHSKNKSEVLQFFNKAIKLREKGNTLESLDNFKNALILANNNSRILYEIAITYEKMNLPQKAKIIWEKIFNQKNTPDEINTIASEKLKLHSNLFDDIDSEIHSVLNFSNSKIEKISSKKNEEKIKIFLTVKSLSPQIIQADQVRFKILVFDQINGKTIDATTAESEVKENTYPSDWHDNNKEETFEIIMSRKISKNNTKDSRNFFGYKAWIYYNNEEQDTKTYPQDLEEHINPNYSLPVKGNGISNQLFYKN